MDHIGIRLPDENSGYSVHDVVDTAVRAEALGYHSVWVAEGHGRNAFMLLARIAQETTRIRLGIGIANVFSRSPSLIAMSTATLEEVAPGRVILGLGASSHHLIEQWHGMAYDRPLRRTREAIEIIRTALESDRVQYAGDLFEITHPRDFRTPDRSIPIYNAALQPQNRRLTVEYADGWLPTKLPIGALADQITEIHTWAERAGRDPNTITIAPFITTCVSPNATAATEAMSEYIAFSLGAMEYYATRFRSLGYDEEVTQIQRAWDSDTSTAYEHVPTDVLEDATITGSPAHGRDRLTTYSDIGVNLAILRPPDTASRTLIDDTLRELAPTTH